MERVYNPKEVEPKWQKYWEENHTFKTDVWDGYYVPYEAYAGL